MSISSQTSVSKRDWEYFNGDAQDSETRQQSTEPLPIQPSDPFVSPEKKNKRDMIYEFDGISVFNSPLGMSQSPAQMAIEEHHIYDMSPKSDSYRMFRQVMLSPGMYDGSFSPAATSSRYQNENPPQQAPSSKDWCFLTQSQLQPEFSSFPNTTYLPFSSDYNQDNEFQQNNSNEVADSGESSSYADEDYDVNNNPLVQKTMETLKQRSHSLRKLNENKRDDARLTPQTLFPQDYPNDSKGNSFTGDLKMKVDFSSIPKPMGFNTGYVDNSQLIGSQRRNQSGQHLDDNLSQSSLNQQSQSNSNHVKSFGKSDIIRGLKDKMNNNTSINRGSVGIALSDQSKSAVRKSSVKTNGDNNTNSLVDKRKRSSLASSDVPDVNTVASALTSFASPPLKQTPMAMSSGGTGKSSNAMMAMINGKMTVICNCKKSRCLKLYCDCFKIEKYCDGCNCVDCANLPTHENDRKQASASILDRNPNAFASRISTAASVHIAGCKCKKSYCLKKYCECFSGSVACTDKCRCQDCKNTVDQYQGFNYPGNSGYVNRITSQSTYPRVIADSDPGRTRSDSWTTSYAGNGSTVSIPGSASSIGSISSMTGLAGLAGLAIKSANPSPNIPKDLNATELNLSILGLKQEKTRYHSNSRRNGHIDSDGIHDDNDDQNIVDDDEYCEDDRGHEGSHHSQPIARSRDNSNRNMTVNDFIIRQKSSDDETDANTLELDMDHISTSEGPKSSRRSSPRYRTRRGKDSPSVAPLGKKSPMNRRPSPHYDSTINPDRYMSPPRSSRGLRESRSLSQMSSVSDNEYIQTKDNLVNIKEISPANSDEAKSTVSRLLELGQMNDDRQREAREASESLLLLSPQRANSSNSGTESNDKNVINEYSQISLLTFSSQESNNNLFNHLS